MHSPPSKRLGPSLRRHLYRYRANQRQAIRDDLEGFFLDRLVTLRERLGFDQSTHDGDILDLASCDLTSRGYTSGGRPRQPHWRRA